MRNILIKKQRIIEKQTFTEKPTITRIFLVNPLGIRREDLERNNLLNAYSYMEGYDAPDEYTVYLLFKPSDAAVFSNFVLIERISNRNGIKQYNYENGLIVLQYHISERWHRDVDKIKAGKYSTVSEEFKELFPKTVKIKLGISEKETKSIQHRIFIKDESLRLYWEEKIGAPIPKDMEVWYGWDKEKETFKAHKMSQIFYKRNLKFPFALKSFINLEKIA